MGGSVHLTVDERVTKWVCLPRISAESWKRKMTNPLVYRRVVTSVDLSPTRSDVLKLTPFCFVYRFVLVLVNAL